MRLVGAANMHQPGSSMGDRLILGKVWQIIYSALSKLDEYLTNFVWVLNSYSPKSSIDKPQTFWLIRE